MNVIDAPTGVTKKKRRKFETLRRLISPRHNQKSALVLMECALESGLLDENTQSGLADDFLIRQNPIVRRF
jgi:hypothetical protein